MTRADHPSAGNHAEVQYTRELRFAGESRAECLSYRVQDNMRQHRLQLRLRVGEGKIAWSFADPGGEVQWRGNAAAGDAVEEAKTLPAIIGDWTLVLEAAAATADARVRWAGRG